MIQQLKQENNALTLSLQGIETQIRQRQQAIKDINQLVPQINDLATSPNDQKATLLEAKLNQLEREQPDNIIAITSAKQYYNNHLDASYNQMLAYSAHRTSNSLMGARNQAELTHSNQQFHKYQSKLSQHEAQQLANQANSPAGTSAYHLEKHMRNMMDKPITPMPEPISSPQQQYAVESAAAAHRQQRRGQVASSSMPSAPPMPTHLYPQQTPQLYPPASAIQPYSPQPQVGAIQPYSPHSHQQTPGMGGIQPYSPHPPMGAIQPHSPHPPLASGAIPHEMNHSRTGTRHYGVGTNVNH